MALIKCPECGKENVSSGASFCPNCGFNIREYCQNQETKDSPIIVTQVDNIDEVERKFKIFDKQKEETLQKNKDEYEQGLKAIENANDSDVSDDLSAKRVVIGMIIFLSGMIVAIAFNIVLGLIIFLFGVVPMFIS